MNDRKKKILSTAFLIPLFILTLYETIHQGGFTGVIGYALKNFKEFFTNYVIIFCLVNVFYFMRRKVYFGMALFFAVFFGLFAYANQLKTKFRGEPITPTDFYLRQEAIDISAYMDLTLTKPMALAIGAVLFLILVIVLLPKETATPVQLVRKKRMVSFASIVMVSLVTFNMVSLQTVFGVDFVTSSLKDNTDRNGLLLGFLLNAQNPDVEISDDYSAETIKRIVETTNPNKKINNDFNPNVIVVLSEALWDPTQMKGLEFNQDPIPFFRSLTKTHSSGTIVNPVYGGGTINSELQVLTGTSTEFVAPGASLHKYIDHPVDSLASLLGNQGYNSIAVHTFNNWFYERNRLYKELGFDRFYSLEFFENPEYHGDFVKDKVLMEQVLKEMKSSPEQDFIYAPTVEGHGPYETDSLASGKIQVTSDVTDKTKNIVTDYANRINGFDESLRLLIEGVKELNEPTIVVVYGDHLPMLGEEESVYKELGYFNGESTYEDFMKKYSTSLLVWDNFSGKKENLKMSGSFVPAYILDLAQKEGSYLTDHLSVLYKAGHSVLLRETFQDKEKMTQQEIDTMKNLQYDAIFGLDYAYRYGDKPRPQPNQEFQLGKGRMEIDSPTDRTVLAGTSQKIEIQLTGNDFVVENKVSDMVVSVNGEVVPFHHAETKKISFYLPRKFYDSPGEVEVRVLLKDNTNQILASSNNIVFTVE